MLVSVVTPSFNQAAYLEQTLQSVLDQQGVTVEYLVVDGGSTDGSIEIIEKYSSQLAWWVSEPDSGQAEAINKGLQRASGEIVAWLNSDDLYLPNAIKQAVNAFQEYPQAGMVFGNAVTIDEHGKVLNHLVFGDWGLDELMAFRIICQPAVFMRRAALEQVGFLDPTFHFLLDHQLWIRLARSVQIQHIPATWAAARHHPGAKNVNMAAGFGEEALRILTWMQTQPDLAGRVENQRNKIEAGAYRLRARYLLDGGFSKDALGAYFQSFKRNPRFALKHWHRILYAALSLVGGRSLLGVYRRIRTKPGNMAIKRSLPSIKQFSNTPGDFSSGRHEED